MKILARCLVFVTVLAVLAAGYVLWAFEADCVSAGYVVESAADRSEAFDGILRDWQSGSERITLLTDGGLAGADQYTFVSYTIHLKNKDIVPLEWISVTPETHEGDVMLIMTDMPDVPAFGETDVSFIVMVDRGSTNYARSVKLGYYIYGHYKEKTVMFR